MNFEMFLWFDVINQGEGERACGVCGDKTNFHEHYGAVVCHPCRIFFRRASNNRARASWKCKLGKENCIIASETKSFCKKCRYSKCIEIGMKPSLVDKTKKAVEEFYANQSCSTVSSEQSPIEEIYSEESISKVGSSLQYTTEPSHPRNEYLLQPQQNAIEILSSTEILPQSHVLPEHMFFKETIAQKVGSNETASSFHCDLEEQVSLARQTFASLHETGCNLVREKFLISNKYTPEEISYFSFVSNAVKLHQYRMMNRICSDPQCQNELLDYTQQIKAIEQTGSNHLKYSPILEGKMKHIGIENVGLLFEAFNPEVTGLNLNSVSKLFSSCQDVLSLFFNHAYSDVTHRHLHEIFFPKNDFPLPAESVLDLNNPDIIHSNLFASPWAPSLRLEEFFYQTAESVKELLKDPVKVYIVIPILIASYSTDAGLEANTFVNKGQLVSLLFKYILRKTKSSDVANNHLSRILKLLGDIKICSEILEKASFIKSTDAATGNDLDNIQVQEL